MSHAAKTLGSVVDPSPCATFLQVQQADGKQNEAHDAIVKELAAAKEKHTHMTNKIGTFEQKVWPVLLAYRPGRSGWGIGSFMRAAACSAGGDSMACTHQPTVLLTSSSCLQYHAWKARAQGLQPAVCTGFHAGNRKQEASACFAAGSG